jgi:hypothetical protein
MYIGIIDIDALQFPDKFFPNLEVMKVASYHWGKGDYVELVLDLHSPLEKYNKIYAFQTNINGEFQSQLFTRKNCEYYNSAIYGGEHIPMSTELENSVPNIEIYNQFFNKIYNINLERQKNINKWKKAKFIRIYEYNEDGIIKLFDNSEYLEDYVSRANVYIYDTNLFNVDAQTVEKIINILSNYTNITCLIPQKISDINMLNIIVSQSFFSAKNIFIYNGMVDKYLIKTICKYSSLYKREVKIEVGYDTNNTYTENYMKQLFRKVLIWSIYISAHGQKISLVAHPDIPESSYRTLISIAGFWINFSSKNLTFYEHVQKTGKQKVLATLINLMNTDKTIYELANTNYNNFKEKGVIFI